MEIRKYLETNKNENTTYQNLWDAAKAILTGNFMVVNIYIIKGERSQINYLTLHLKELEKGEQIKSEVNRRNKIMNIRREINELRVEKQQKKINKTRS